MAATWTIRSLQYRNDVDGFDRVVEVVKFTATDEGALPFPSVVGRYEGGVRLRPWVLDPFTDFASLTEEQVLNWVFQVLGAQTVADIEDGIAADVAAQGHPRRGTGVPW